MKNTLMNKATLMFLIDNNKILLAMKKRGFGAGKWNGVGGKQDGNETIEQTAIRECEEEIGVLPDRIIHVATLDFYFPGSRSDWNQQVIVYICSTWKGEAVETDEMRPKWFDINNIPYEAMWTDDRYWLPLILAGKYVAATFTFDEKDNVIENTIKTKQLPI